MIAKFALTAINGQVIFNMKLFKEQLDIFSKSDYSTMLLSEEDLFLYLNNKDFFPNIDSFWELLSNYEVKVIVYFRKSIEYITALWKEHIALRHIKTLENHLETWNYAESLKGFDNLLPRLSLDNIIVRTYEPTRWLNHNLIEDFLHALNIENYDDFYR